MRSPTVLSAIALIAFASASHAGGIGQKPGPQHDPGYSRPAGSSGTVQFLHRNVEQLQRIERGLRSGALSTREAARLQGELAGVHRLQASVLWDGDLDRHERTRIDQAQDAASRQIQAALTHGVRGWPHTTSVQRMVADVQRSITQQQRIEQGARNGSLSNREIARLQAGQARVASLESVNARDGVVTAAEQARVQQVGFEQNRDIHRETHDFQRR